MFLKVKNIEEITPQQLSRMLEEQQRPAITKWVADPFGNFMRAFPVELPTNSKIMHLGKLCAWSTKPFQVCLTIHEVKVGKTGSRRATRLPDGGVVLADGKWTWGPGNGPAQAATEPSSGSASADMGSGPAGNGSAPVDPA